MVVTVQTVVCSALRILPYQIDSSVKHQARLFKAHFGVSPVVVSSVWNRMDEESLLPSNALPKHLLWTLLFLKLYSSSDVLASMCGVTAKT